MSFFPYSRSIVPVDGPVRYLYNQANRTGYEHKSVKFWSLWLHYEGFPERDWLVTTEQPPDGSESLRRVDIVIDKYDPNEDTLSSVVWVEAKKPGGDYNTVYRQALDAGQRAIVHDSLPAIYVVTTVGTAFCMWYLEAGKTELTPLNGPGYIDADSEESHVMAEGIALTKSSPPSGWRQPSLASLCTPSTPKRHLFTTWFGQDDSGQGVGNEHGQSYDQLQQQQEPDPGPSGEGSSGGPTASTKYHRVQVVKKGFLGGDYCFQDHRGKERKTKKSDWTKGKYKGQRVWLYKGGHSHYYTKELP